MDATELHIFTIADLKIAATRDPIDMEIESSGALISEQSRTPTLSSLELELNIKSIRFISSTIFIRSLRKIGSGCSLISWQGAPLIFFGN